MGSAVSVGVDVDFLLVNEFGKQKLDKTDCISKPGTKTGYRVEC